MSERGFFVVHRRARRGWLWQLPPDQFKVAMTILADANWCDGTTVSAGRVVEIKRGQLMTSIASLARETGVSEKRVRTTLKLLEKAGFLASETTNRFRILSLPNYDFYQGLEHWQGQADGQVNGQATGKQRASQGQATGNDITREPVNQGTREPDMSSAPPSDSREGKAPHPRALRGAEVLRDYILAADPGNRIGKSWNERTHRDWARTIDLMHRRDGRSFDEIAAAVHWLFTAENLFVVHSASALRKKFDSIRAAMKRARTDSRPAEGAPLPVCSLPDELPKSDDERLAEWDRKDAERLGGAVQ